MSCWRRALTAGVAKGWVRGMPYLRRYARASKPCFCRWRPESHCNAIPHSRHVMLEGVMLACHEGTAASWGERLARCPVSWALSARRWAWVSCKTGTTAAADSWPERSRAKINSVAMAKTEDILRVPRATIAVPLSRAYVQSTPVLPRGVAPEALGILG